MPAFGVIKETIANGKELYEAGQALAGLLWSESSDTKEST